MIFNYIIIEFLSKIFYFINLYNFIIDKGNLEFNSRFLNKLILFINI